MLWLLFIFLVLILGVVSYLLFAPVILEIDSTRGILGVRWRGVAWGRVVFFDESFYVSVRVAWWQRRFPLTGGDTQDKKKKKPAKREEGLNRKRRKRRGPKEWFQIGISVLKTFRVTKCNIDIDTGSASTNGMLYPVVWWLARKADSRLSINFEGRNKVELEIGNSLARMAGTFIYHFIKTKTK